MLTFLPNLRPTYPETNVFEGETVSDEMRTDLAEEASSFTSDHFGSPETAMVASPSPPSEFQEAMSGIRDLLRSALQGFMEAGSLFAGAGSEFVGSGSEISKILRDGIAAIARSTANKCREIALHCRNHPAEVSTFLGTGMYTGLLIPSALTVEVATGARVLYTIGCASSTVRTKILKARIHNIFNEYSIGVWAGLILKAWLEGGGKTEWAMVCVMTLILKTSLIMSGLMRNEDVNRINVVHREKEIDDAGDQDQDEGEEKSPFDTPGTPYFLTEKQKRDIRKETARELKTRRASQWRKL